MMRVALTGATGFVGAATLARLVEAGHEVRALTRREQPPQPSVMWIAGSLEDEAALIELCEGCDAVIHVAGVVGARDRATFERGNVDGTRNMLAAANSAGVTRFVHVSSLAAREPQLSLYCGSKRGAEDLVTTSALDWTVVRPPAVYGPGDSEMIDAYRAAGRGFAPMPPKGRLSLIHVDDLARLLVALLPKGTASGLILEPDDGHENGWSHAEYARMIGAAMGRKPIVVHMPGVLLKLAAIGDETMRGEKAKLTRDRAHYLVHPDWVANPDNRPDAGLWQAEIESAAGICQTADWYRRENHL